MKTAYIILVLAVLLWKGYYAWQRGVRAYRKVRLEHDSLREYLLGNGATPWQSVRPFYRYALVRAIAPLRKQWLLWAVLALLGVLVVMMS